MHNYDQLNHEFLPKIDAKLSAVRQLPINERHDGITDLLANVSLSPDERVKLRGRLTRDFGYLPKDFDQVFGCRFSLFMWEKIGRGS